MSTFLIRDRTGKVIGKIRGANSAEEAEAAFRRQHAGGSTPADQSTLLPQQLEDRKYSVGDYVAGGAKYGAIGAGMGAVVGGPVGAATGFLGGATGEVIAMGLEDMGVGGGGQFGGSLVADIGVSALSRRPTAGLLRRIPKAQEITKKGVEYLGKGGVVKRFLGRNWAAEATGYAERQAGKLITDLPGPGAADPAVEVAESVRSGHQYMDDVYQSAREQAKKETLGSYGQTEALVRKSDELMEKFKYLDEIPSVLRRAAELPDQITLGEAENIRKGVGAAYAKGDLPRAAGGIPHYREMSGLYEPLDDVLTDIAEHSESGERAVGAVRKMRGARAAMHQAAPEGGAMYRTLIGEGRMDNAQKALDRIFSSDKAVAEVKLIRGMMGGIGDDIALQRAAIAHVLQRGTGMGAGTVASQGATGGTAIRRASSESAALTEILGERGFGHLMGILEDVASAGGGTRLSSGRSLSMSRLLMILAGSAGVGSVVDPRLGAAVLGLGAVVEAFARMNGKEAVGKLALSALVDADIYRLVAMGASVKNAEAAATRLGQTLVRRGLFAADELGGDG